MNAFIPTFAMEGHGGSQAGTPFDPHKYPRQNPVDPREVFKSLSPEEIATLKECARQSFYTRCIPFAAVSSGVVYWASKAGYLGINMKVGIAGACLLSYITGKWSYRQRCMEMIMALPNSQLGAVLKRNRGILSSEEEMQYMTGPSSSPGSGFPSRDVRDIDMSRTGSSYSQGPERERPLLDLSPSSGPPIPEEEAPEGAPTRYRSFDDIRRDNRAEFMRGTQRFTSDGGRIVQPDPVPLQAPLQSSTYLDSKPRAVDPAPPDDFNPGKRFQRKNKYGDPVEE